MDVHGGPLTPPPDPAAGDGTGGSDPQSIGGGAVSQAGGSSSASGGSNGAGGATGDGSGGDASNAADPSAPKAGTGFWPADNSHWVFVVLLVLAGAALVVHGARGARSRKL